MRQLQYCETVPWSPGPCLSQTNPITGEWSWWDPLKGPWDPRVTPSPSEDMGGVADPRAGCPQCESPSGPVATRGKYSPPGTLSDPPHDTLKQLGPCRLPGTSTTQTRQTEILLIDSHDWKVQKRPVKVKVLVAPTLVMSVSHVRLSATPWIVTCQVPLSLGFSRQAY